ncbi:hypothetical protein MKUB_08380 [Mycobacterium kubicae]|uniref:Uncharacterized protein n=1 Tax=Mycobacterium kubicae TaxID=120959 RepID=A0ABQ1BI06_9MYCO|nr:hypothetical protein MKUB_08380 [Mycobacterium kubicae]
MPSTVIGVTGVDRGAPVLRPGTVRTTGLSPPKFRPSFDIWMNTLFAGLSHHGGRIRSAMPATVVTPAEREASLTFGAERAASLTFVGRD